MKYQIKEDTKTKMFRSGNYNYNFNKETGEFMRWGSTFNDDPIMAPFPEILDIEVEERCNGIPGVNGIESPCHFCSPDGTLVNTPSGMKNISEIVIGDKVLSWDGNDIVQNEVVDTYKHNNATELIKIELENGFTIELTPDHLVFLTDGSTKPAGEITYDDDIKINEI